MALLKELDRIEILTLQDNYIDLLDAGSNPMLARANPIKDGFIQNSVLAEHGFSAFIRLTAGDEQRCLLFDFGYSPEGVKHNIEALDVDPAEIEITALSHGHMDHFGGMPGVRAVMPQESMDLVVHPSVFKPGRHISFGEDFKIYFPPLVRAQTTGLGFNLIETAEPLHLLDGAALFLGQIPRETPYEQGMPNACYEEDGCSVFDPIEDDTALVFALKGKGLVVLSGCAHSGIINTVKHAVKTTAIDDVHVVMGGFHLSGPQFEPIIDPTIEDMQKFNPDYVVPTHCTGRPAITAFEREMPQAFILNMSGTRLTFTA